MFSWFASLLSRSGSPSGSVAELWEAYKVNLDVLNSRFNRCPGDDGKLGSRDSRIDDLLRDPGPGPRSFKPLYEAEQRLAVYLPDDDLIADASRRFPEAERLGVASTSLLQEVFFQEATTIHLKRAIYYNLIDDIQFRYQKRALDRRTRRSRANWHNVVGLVLIIPTGWRCYMPITTERQG